MEITQELEALITGKVLFLPGERMRARKKTLVSLTGMEYRKLNDHGLDRVQTVQAWLCRYSNMRYHQEREKRYKP